jgi:hypothetical protein
MGVFDGVRRVKIENAAAGPGPLVSPRVVSSAGPAHWLIRAGFNPESYAGTTVRFRPNTAFPHAAELNIKKRHLTLF